MISAYYAALVDKMLGGGNPAKIGSIAYHCLQGGEGPQRVSMSGKSSLCLRCAKVYVANGVSHVSRMRHAGVIDRPIVLTMPAMVRKTFDQQSQALLSPFMRCGSSAWMMASAVSGASPARVAPS